LGLYNDIWAIGISSFTLAARVGDGGWFALFNDKNPTNSASATQRDANAFFGVNKNYMQYDGVVALGGKIAMGHMAPAASAAIDVGAAAGAILFPRMTTAQRNALTPANGMMIYNTDAKAFQVYQDAAWKTLVVS
jgi:hypothetical protein